MSEPDLTPAGREALRRLESAATPGPWTSPSYAPASVLWCGHGTRFVASGLTIDDAAFIAASRTTVPTLLDALDRAEARIAELEESVELGHTLMKLKNLCMDDDRAQLAAATAREARLRKALVKIRNAARFHGDGFGGNVVELARAALQG